MHEGGKKDVKSNRPTGPPIRSWGPTAPGFLVFYILSLIGHTFLFGNLSAPLKIFLIYFPQPENSPSLLSYEKRALHEGHKSHVLSYEIGHFLYVFKQSDNKTTEAHHTVFVGC